jgi:hypothetical protein
MTQEEERYREICEEITWNAESMKWWEEHRKNAYDKKNCDLTIAGHKKEIGRLLKEKERLVKAGLATPTIVDYELVMKLQKVIE